ncbi:hypothetical protein ABT009_18080 [Streptomyces sp. NPDC002896]|uniref:hypothetical protein n=1 Tax=Streptomyces sp. NPDC002896 TaxID=3154438 RepID=UPI00331DEA63
MNITKSGNRSNAVNGRNDANSRSRVRTFAGLVSGVCAAALLLTGCGGGDQDAGSVPSGWGTLKTKGVDVSYPKGSGGYVEQSAAERSKHNAAAAVRTENGTTVSTITVQLDFTNADSAEEAAIAAEAGVQLGSTLKGEKDVKLAGTDEAKRVDFEFSSTGEKGTPPKGTRIQGVILTGLDSRKKTFAVRIDAQKGALDDADLKKIIDSVQVH